MNIGFALRGSYCTFSKIFPVMEALAREHRVIPIFSDNVQKTGSRFGEPAEFYEKAFQITGIEPICTIADAEPIGRKSSSMPSSSPPVRATPWQSSVTASRTHP